MDANFFQAAPDPQQDPIGYMRAQNLARSLQQQGAATPQGQMVGGKYQAPGAGQYATQMASALMGGMAQNKINDAQRASTLLNGGTPQQSGLSKFGSWIGGLFGGGGA